MSLRGTIGDFGTAQVLQLLASQRKSGRLALSSGADDVVLLFFEGEIVGVEHPARPTAQRLGAMLVAAEVLTEEALRRAVDDAQGAKRPLGASLVALGLVTPEVLDKMLDLQRRETLDDLFQWQEGTYELDSRAIEKPSGGPPPISPEALVLHGIQILNDWPAIVEKLPSFDAVLVRARELPALTEAEAAAEAMEEPDAPLELMDHDDAGGEPTTFERIEPNDRAVYALIGPGRDIHKLIALSRLGTFHTCRSLATLISYGYVAAPRPRPAEPEPPPPAEVKAKARPGLGRPLVLAAAAAAAVLVIARVATVVPAIGAVHAAPISMESVGSTAHRRVLARLLEAYRLEVGVYPVVLEDLVAAGYARERDLLAPGGASYRYTRTGSGFELTRTGGPQPASSQ